MLLPLIVVLVSAGWISAGMREHEDEFRQAWCNGSGTRPRPAAALCHRRPIRPGTSSSRRPVSVRPTGCRRCPKDRRAALRSEAGAIGRGRPLGRLRSWTTQSAPGLPRRALPGGASGRTWPSGRGAPCARTTARTATPGTTSPTSRRDRGPIGGARTASAASATSPSCSACLLLLERARPDPEGTNLRPQRSTGQPRGGRQGVLVVSRLHADALVDAWRYLYPQAAFPYEEFVSENARRTKLDPEYELLDTGIFDDDRYCDVTVDYAKAGPTTMSASVSVSATPARRTPRCTSCRHSGSAIRGRGVIPPRPATADRGGRRWARRHARATRPFRLVADGKPELLFCENNIQRASVSGGWPEQSPTRRTASTTMSSSGAPRSTRTRRGTKAAFYYRLECRGEARRRSRSGWRAGRRRRRTSACGNHAGLGAGHGRTRARGRRVLRRRSRRPTATPTRPRPAPGFCRHALVEAVLPLRRERWLDGDPGRPAPPPAAPVRAELVVASPQQPRRHLHARHLGVPLVCLVGSRLSLRRARPCRARRSRSTSCSRSAASGTCTRTASCPRTSGTSVTSTRPCRRGRPCGSSRSMATNDFAFLRADLRQAAHQLHVVGQPQGRPRQQRVRGRVPRSRQHRADRPVRTAARRRFARTSRRDVVDGHVLPQHARDRPCPRPPRPGLRGHGHQVLRALRVHRRRRCTARGSGTSRTVSSTTCYGWPEATACRSASGPLSASCRCAPR